MQGIMETIFDIWYLLTVLILGAIMIKSKNKYFKLFGIMTLLLGIGDSFHLIPRSYALLTDGLENHAFALGLGKLITSITMTIFYCILYEIWKKHFKIEKNTYLDCFVYALAIIRIILCLLPFNDWFNYNAPYEWGIYRNIPFVILGVVIIYLFFKEGRKDEYFKNMYLAILLSFLFYIAVVLFADTYSIIGMFMLPKTICYVWIIYMGYKEYKGN